MTLLLQRKRVAIVIPSSLSQKNYGCCAEGIEGLYVPPHTTLSETKKLRYGVLLYRTVLYCIVLYECHALYVHCTALEMIPKSTGEIYETGGILRQIATFRASLKRAALRMRESHGLSCLLPLRHQVVVELPAAQDQPSHRLLVVVHFRVRLFKAIAIQHTQEKKGFMSTVAINDRIKATVLRFGSPTHE